MPFPTVDNDMLNVGAIAGHIPVIGAGDKLSNSLFDAGVSANKIVQLDGTAKLPAIDGSLLTNLPASGGGAWNHLSTQVADNVAQVDFTGLITSTYKTYALFIEDIEMSANASVVMRLSSNNGASFDAGPGDYQYAVRGYSTNLSTVNTSSTSNDFIAVSVVATVGATEKFAGLLYLYNPLESNVASHMSWRGVLVDSSTRTFNGVARRAQQQAHNAIRLFPTSGIFVKGTFKFYGLS